ncbi:MAG TPA: hypothetical protein VMG11_07185 [Steroidobacteraceae bacterium]|nr:hypothetical protein [Steroidobacteraceae bacterium]
MVIRSFNRPLPARVIVMLLSASVAHVASAVGSGRGGSGSHAAGGFSAAGTVDGGYGWRGAPAHSPGEWGWGKWGRWGWGPGLGGIGLGAYQRILPWSYATRWWAGVPYYYVNHAYYLWDDRAGEYEQVAPPPGLAARELQQPASRLAPTASR